MLGILIFSGGAVAQDTRTFTFKGTVYDKSTEKPLEKYLVDVYEGNTIIQSVACGKKGRFEVDLFGGGEYIIDIYQEGYYPKRVLVRTNIPKDIKHLADFKFDVDLIPTSDYDELEEKDPFATSVFDFPYVIFEFDKDLNDLNYRKAHNDIMKDKYSNVHTLK